jgi:hypothetical protein
MSVNNNLLLKTVIDIQHIKYSNKYNMVWYTKLSMLKMIAITEKNYF